MLHRVKQEVGGPLTNLTGRQVHASSQQVSQRAVFCHLLLDTEEGNEGKGQNNNPGNTNISMTMDPNILGREEMEFLRCKRARCWV